MDIKVRLNEQIINNSLKLHYHYFGATHKKRLLLVPVILVAVSVYLMYTEIQKSKLGTNFYLGILYIIFAIAYYYYMLYRMKNLGKTLLKNLGENINFDMDITESSITTKLASSTTTTDWSAFKNAIISNDIILLYQQNNTFSMFEKSFFNSDAEFNSFKNIITQNIPDTIQHS
ncbi:MAG: YcxB family protein [Sphingobacteriales bacterium]|nr:YcxB family protein [Sphingobacteriales bacterium]